MTSTGAGQVPSTTIAPTASPPCDPSCWAARITKRNGKNRGRADGRGLRAAPARCGLPPINRPDAGPGRVAGRRPLLVIAGHAFVAPACLASFVGGARAVGGHVARLALSRTAAVDFLRPVS